MKERKPCRRRRLLLRLRRRRLRMTCRSGVVTAVPERRAGIPWRSLCLRGMPTMLVFVSAPAAHHSKEGIAMGRRWIRDKRGRFVGSLPDPMRPPSAARPPRRVPKDKAQESESANDPDEFRVGGIGSVRMSTGFDSEAPPCVLGEWNASLGRCDDCPRSAGRPS